MIVYTRLRRSALRLYYCRNHPPEWSLRTPALLATDLTWLETLVAMLQLLSWGYWPRVKR